jgi:isopentenyl diphosphate isomerase/L-lactate dehydrogenase-like FMN-dependent dehydrogenase
MRQNHSAYQRIWFRPRILRDVTNIDFSTTMLGSKTSMPIYVTATALVGVLSSAVWPYLALTVFPFHRGNSVIPKES